MPSIFQSIQLTVLSCSCGITYAIPEENRLEREGRKIVLNERDGKSWKCPNGCGRVYRETEEMRLRRELTAAKSEAMRQQQLRESAERAKAQAELDKKRIEKRAKAALCPCCNRSFVSLARHIQSQHPELVKPANKLQCKITERNSK